MANQPEHSATPGNPASYARPVTQVTPVTVTDIDMPFLSMMSFMVKWALATIPAFFILAVVGGMGWGILVAIFR
jgi:hypothetical protein